MTALSVVADGEAAAHLAADRIAGVIAGGGEVHVGVAGGSTPKRAYELLAERDLDWSGVHLWLGDERCVPADHEDANERMVRRALGDRGTLHGVRGELGPEDAAWLYGRELVAALGEEPVLDVVLLGLGEDAHTASLFPGHAEVEATHAPVLPVRGAPKPPPERITFALPVLRRARMTMLLTTGTGKRDALAKVLRNDEAAPAGRLGTAFDEIICDEAAAPPESASA